jgi:hypothetical protein
LAWSFEHEGHIVTRLQENEVDRKAFDKVYDCDMFLWVKTPGWLKLSDVEMYYFLGTLRVAEIPSVGFHLDRFWGIPEREELIGKTPFWSLDHVFTADGGNQDGFKKRKVNHHWLPPGVVERGCHYGTPREEYRCDVGFVGATEGYHPCYPFRQQMIEFLREKYRSRFKTFSGVREQQLNDVYASVKVCVGDSIFAGAPKYWSDRLPETCGRGGFLVYPNVKGMTIPAPSYSPQNLDALTYLIDWYLTHPEQRRKDQRRAFEHVRKHDTYTQRVRTILKKVFG